MRNILFCSLLLMMGLAQAGMVEVPLDGVQRLVVKGWDANVTVTAQPQTRSIKINGVEDVLSPGLYIVERKGNILEVHMNEWNTKSEWKTQISQKRNRNRLEISGPSIPIEIFLKEGNVQLQRWGKEAKVVLLQGKVTSTDGTGPLDINVHQGEIQIPSQTGKLKIDQYQGQANVKNLNGDLDLSTFSSTVNIEKAKGAMSLNTQIAPVKVAGSSGSLQVENGRGPITVQQFQGRVDGSTQEGPLNLQMLPESEVHLKSHSGRVTVQLPGNSGAGLNLLTKEGEILVPQGLKVNRGATERTFRGRLKGDSQKAAVTVRSVEGTIVIK